MNEPCLRGALLAATDITRALSGRLVFDTDRLHRQQLLDEHVAGEIMTTVVCYHEFTTAYWAR